MKKLLTALVAAALIIALSSCAMASKIPDGTYKIEAETYDSRGYKDFITFTFSGGELVSMVADAASEKGATLKSADAELKTAMEDAVGTYPEKYYKDLVNQYIEKVDAGKIDIVAGATASSKTFIELMKKAEKAAKSGNVKGVFTELS